MLRSSRAFTPSRRGSATIVSKLKSGRLGEGAKPLSGGGSRSASRVAIAHHIRAGRSALQGAGRSRTATNSIVRRAAKTGMNRAASFGD